MRFVLLLAIALLGAACATPAARGLTMQLDPVAACALRAPPGEREACVGATAHACLETEEGGTTAGAVACYAREREQWGQLRNSISDNLRETESQTQGALLDSALAEHARWAAAHCAYAASIYEGGSLARVVAAQCMRDAVAEHTLSLMARHDEP